MKTENKVNKVKNTKQDKKVEKKDNILFKKIIIFSFVAILLIGFGVGLSIFNKSQKKLYSNEMLNLNNTKVQQNFEDLGYVDRNISKDYNNEGICERYPVYGKGLDNISDTEKDNLIAEANKLFADEGNYDAIDQNGNYILNGVATGKKLYKHTASKDMYEGNVSDTEKAIIRKVNVNPTIWRNYITGLYAAPGELVKIEISKSDLEKIGSLKVAVGQVTHKNTRNNIWKADKNIFSRLPNIANTLNITSTTAYVGNPLGGPIYIYPEKHDTFSVTISGAVEYPCYIHGYTTREEFERMKPLSAPYYDFEVWDKGVRHSGPKSRANFDYDNLIKVGDLWEKICRTSSRVPTNSSAESGVGYIYDPFVAAGEAVAFVGGRIAVNAPLYWMSGALDYNGMVKNGFWGTIHEFNHHFQNYGMEGASTNEVTNNATSLLSYALYTDISSARSEDDSTLSGWNRYTDPSRSLRETLSNYGSGNKGLNVYADIIHSFGVDKFIEATRLDAKKYTSTSWYEALCKATGYDMTYYFEKVLGLTIDADVKANYTDGTLPVFVPIASLYQTGRNFFSGKEEVNIETVRPYLIERDKEFILDLDNYLYVPKDFEYKIKKITKPSNGTLTKINNNKYKYNPKECKRYSGIIKVTIELINSEIKTPDVTLSINLGFKNSDPERVLYTYEERIFNTPDEALNANFEGYTEKEKSNSSSTFMNHISANKIGYLNGKILVPEDGKYTICLRAGRGNHALYISLDGKEYEKKIEFSGDKGGFDLDENHCLTIEAKKGQLIWYKQITISNNHPDAFTELGWTNSEQAPQSIAKNYLYNSNAIIEEYSFESDIAYPYVYTDNLVFYKTNPQNQKVISINQDSWDDTTKIDNILDGDDSTYYHSNKGNFLSSDNPFELVLDLGEEKTWNKVRFVGRASGVNHIPTTFKIYGSKDNVSYSLIDEFKDLKCTGIELSTFFKISSFRYVKIVVTDSSLTSGNKYVCLSRIDFSYELDGTNISCNELNYYGKWTVDNSELSSYGHVVKGSGTIKFTVNKGSTGLAIFGKTSDKFRAKIYVNGKTIEINSAVNEKIIFKNAIESSKKKQTIQIVVESGTISIDSIFVGN